MKKYQVSVVWYGVTYVEANSEEEAKNLAGDYDHEIDWVDADYFDVTELEGD